MSSHEKFKEEIRLLVLKEFQDNVTLWNYPIGLAQTARGSVIRFGVKGMMDLIGLIKPTGRFVGIEVKTGVGRLRKSQHQMRLAVLEWGGLHHVARSIEGVRDFLLAAVAKEYALHDRLQARPDPIENSEGSGGSRRDPRRGRRCDGRDEQRRADRYVPLSGG